MSDRPTREGLMLPILIPVGCLVLIVLVLYGFSRILLATSADAATGVALVVAVAIMATASLIASRKRQPNGVLFSLFGIVTGVAMLAGGVAVLAFAPAEGEGEAFVAALAAPVGASVDGFSPDRLSVPAGQEVPKPAADRDSTTSRQPIPASAPVAGRGPQRAAQSDARSRGDRVGRPGRGAAPRRPRGPGGEKT